MGLFSKKTCDLCGGEIGLLGNRKLEDGNCCKKCAGKLSPWFDERRHSTIQDIREQLAYREQNEAEAANFRLSRSFGSGSKQLFLDEAAGKFCVCTKNELDNGNPDIVSISDITRNELTTSEYKTEITYKDKEGKTASYNPKRYSYSYDFFYELQVNHPYFDKMRFQINDKRVEQRAVAGPKPGLPGVKGVAHAIGSHFGPDYDRFERMGQDITDALNSLRGITPPAAAEAPDGSWVCEYCGTRNAADSLQCTGCGSSRA